MRRVLLTLSLAFLALFATNAQQTNKEQKNTGRKFYFPAASFTDSVALSKAMSQLASQLVTTDREDNKKAYFDNSYHAYLITGDYTKAAAMMDSLDNLSEENVRNLPLKAFALAKLEGPADDASFEQAYKKVFATAFTKLSFNKRMAVASLDSSMLTWLSSYYQGQADQIKKSTTDSINAKDAQALSRSYIDYMTLKTLAPLLRSYTSDPTYKPTYPAIKNAPWAGVYPVQHIDEVPDPRLHYKLVMELTTFAPKGQDSTAFKELNMGLSSVARQINLHAAAGIPLKNMDVVLVVHAGALYAFLNNEAYKKKYGVDNPNLVVIKELQDYGVKVIGCGQAMYFMGLERENMLPGLKVALTAQTALSSYQLKGYVYYDLTIRD